jgi:hypothetical protein
MDELFCLCPVFAWLYIPERMLLRAAERAPKMITDGVGEAQRLLSVALTGCI